MKGSILLAAAAAAGASAGAAHRHAHEMFKRGEVEVCTPSCKTIYTTIYGEPTLVPKPPKPTSSSSAPPPPPPEPTEPTSTYVPPVDLPTPVPEVCPTPGEYTFPATTITVSETTTVCAPETTKLPPGEHTYGGVTTVVEQATTIVCPYPTEKTESGVVTSVIETTTYVCPEAGTYTIAPTVTVCEKETEVVYPTITTVVPGTYTRPAVVTTITETSVIVVCPWTTEEPKPTEAPPPPPVEAPKPPKEDKKPPPPPKEDKEEKPQPPKGGNLGGGSDDHLAITYTPYTEDAAGECKSAGAVDQDIKDIKSAGFNAVRVYSTDCDTLENVGAACEKHGLRMIIGIFVKTTCSSSSTEIKEQLDAIKAWKKWSIVDLIVVGNECIFQGICQASSLRDLIKDAKKEIDSAGYTGPYTTAETINVWQQDEVAAALCDVIDITGAQIHPFFNSDVAPSGAGKFVKGQLEIAESVCGGKPALNLECGWPTGGNTNGKAKPGKQEQAEAIASIRKECGNKTVFFSWKNDEWKDPNTACGCEQRWGCAELFSS